MCSRKNPIPGVVNDSFPIPYVPRKGSRDTKKEGDAPILQKTTTVYLHNIEV